MREALFQLGNWVALVVSVGVVGVTLTYGFLFRWRARRAGTAVFIFLSALSLLIALNVISLWLGKVWLPNIFGDETIVREIIRIVVYVYAGYAVAWLVYALVYNYRRTGRVLDLEKRASRAKATLEGLPTTKEIEIP